MNTRHKVALVASAVVATTLLAGPAVQKEPQNYRKCQAPSDSHIYNSFRLVDHGCTTVYGTIESVAAEADGDFHYRMRVDSKYEKLLNQDNMDRQRGMLVVEEPCQRKVTQANAIDSCLGYTSPFPRLVVGSRYRVKGHFVTDTQHGWNEIHGISRMDKL